MTVKELVQLGRSVCNSSSEISGIGSSGATANGFGSRMV
jgi:hypothetical protein